jgi:hypothetical protein
VLPWLVLLTELLLLESAVLVEVVAAGVLAADFVLDEPALSVEEVVPDVPVEPVVPVVPVEPVVPVVDASAELEMPDTRPTVSAPAAAAAIEPSREARERSREAPSRLSMTMTMSWRGSGQPHRFVKVSLSCAGRRSRAGRPEVPRPVPRGRSSTPIRPNPCADQICRR